MKSIRLLYSSFLDNFVMICTLPAVTCIFGKELLNTFQFGGLFIEAYSMELHNACKHNQFQLLAK